MVNEVCLEYRAEENINIVVLIYAPFSCSLQVLQMIAKNTFYIQLWLFLKLRLNFDGYFIW